MNAGRLHLALEMIVRDYKENDLISKLTALTETLEASIDSVDEPSALAFRQALEEAQSALAKSPSNFETPTQTRILGEIGASDKIGQGLLSRLQRTLEENIVTPADALASVQNIATEVAHFFEVVQQIVKGFDELHIDYDRLMAGETEVGISVPWEVIDANLEGLQKEIREFDKSFKIIGELVEGRSPESLRIRSVGSSSLQLFINSTPAIAACLITAVERLCALYKQVLEIRSLRKKLGEQSLPKELTAPIEAHEESIVATSIEKLADVLVHDFSKVKDKGRENELRNGLIATLKFFAQQIDAGVDMEARAEPPTAKALADNHGEAVNSPKAKRILEEARAVAVRIKNAGTVMQTLKRGAGPVLTLGEGGKTRAGKSRKTKSSDHRAI